MTRENAVYFGIGAVAGGAVTALFFLFKEGFIFVGDGDPSTQDETPTDGQNDSEKPISFKDTPAQEPSSLVAYHNILHEQGYQAEEIPTDAEVHMVSEEEYFEVGRLGTFDMTALTLYSDDVVANAVTDEVITPGDLASVIGASNTIERLRRMFDNGADILYFRNERLHAQYEMNADERTYLEVTR